MRTFRPFVIALAASLWAAGIAPLHAQDPELGQGLLEEDPAVMAALPKSPTFRAFLPERVDLSPDFPPPGDQGKTQTCVGWATGYALRSYLERQRRQVDLSDPGNRFSPYFVYTQIAPNCNSGARISDALAVQGQVGALPIRDYGTANCNQPPGPGDKARATDYRIGGFRRVQPDKPDDIKGELARGRPVVFGMMVGQAFMSLRGTEIYDLPPKDAKGGHAMILVGYDDAKQAFKVMNSWGSKWGDRGYGWISYRAFGAGTHSAFTADGSPSPQPVPVTQVQPPRPAPAAPPAPAVQPPPRPQPAPAPVVAPAPQRPPAAPPPQRTEPGRIADLARAAPCSRLQVSGNSVRGFVGADAERERLAAAGADVAEVKVLPWPQCEATLTLERALAVNDGLGASVRKPKRACAKGMLCEGDRMIIEVDMPKTNAAHLYVAYVSASGDMVMLEQPQGKAPAARRPAAQVLLGDGPGQPLYHVSGPFGRELLIVLTSASPLFDRELNEQMTERDFLTELRKALIYKPRPTDPDRVVSAVVLPLTTAQR
jgi:hypothetical protein